MCGIAGFMHRERPAGHKSTDTALVENFARALAHRGPDGRGSYVKDGVVLVHTRLAIVDLGGGAQPLSREDGVTLIANAEIYNDPDLRRELTGPFKTLSDCESALHLYCRDGVSFAKGLRGMYAVAIHDPQAQRLVLARDPFGIKPLYYAETRTGFAFASEPQALVAAGLVKPEINAAAREEVLGAQFSAGRETPFAGILRVLPGETLVIEGGALRERHHRNAVVSLNPVTRSTASAAAAFDEVWAESVGVHRRADVPYGMFLSGGIDSAAVLAMMARLDSRPVLAFTAAFPGTAVHDEREAARTVAHAAGAQHVEIEITARDFWDTLPAIAAALDDPVADYAVVPTYLLGRRAVRDVKVVLTGEGGDEMFAGYGRYRAATRMLFPKRPWRSSGVAGFAGLRGWRRAIDAAERDAAGFSTLGAAQAVDCVTWLPGDLLTKLDRCLMAHGLEGRVPFVDPAVAAFAFSLPDRQRIRRVNFRRQGKWLVRRWLAEKFPAAQAFKPKRGFTVPVGEWIAAEGTRLGPLVARAPGVADLCRPAAVEAVFADAAHHGGAAWALLFYALWHRRHMLGLSPVGDVFATLSSF